MIISFILIQFQLLPSPYLFYFIGKFRPYHAVASSPRAAVRTPAPATCLLSGRVALQWLQARRPHDATPCFLMMRNRINININRKMVKIIGERPRAWQTCKFSAPMILSSLLTKFTCWISPPTPKFLFFFFVGITMRPQVLTAKQFKYFVFVFITWNSLCCENGFSTVHDFKVTLS